MATVPDPKSGRAPSIVTDENILLLFDIQEKVFVKMLLTNKCWSKWSSTSFYFSVIRLFLLFLLLFFLQISQVDQIRGNYSGSEVSLTDICLKPLGEDCATQTILQVDNF